jgi:superfamily II DNA/RNA helicase
MIHSMASCHDLSFLVPPDFKITDCIPRQFLVYCDSWNDTLQAACYLHARLPNELCHKIPWVHSGMSDAHKVEVVQGFQAGELFGIVCTDSLGMVCRSGYAKDTS